MIPADEMRQNSRDALDHRLEEFEKENSEVLSKLEKLMSEAADRGSFATTIPLHTSDIDVLKLLSNRALVSDLRLFLELNGYGMTYFHSLKRVRIDWWPETVRQELKKTKRERND